MPLAIILGLAGCSAAVNDDRAGTETPYPIRTVAAGASPSPGGVTIFAVTRDRAGEAILSTAIAAGPADPGLLRQRAAIRVALLDLDGAIADLDAAMALGTPIASVLLDRGVVLFRRGAWDRALADFDAAIRLQPGLGDAYVGRALARSAMANGEPQAYRAALDDLTLAQATADPPTSIPAARARILLDRHAFRGDPADLASVVQGFRAEPPAGTAEIVVAVEALARSGDLPGAEALLASAADVTSPEERGSLALASAHIGQAAGDTARFTAQAREALAADPWSWRASRSRVEASLAAGRAEDARDLATTALGRHPDDPVLLFLLGRALIDTGEGNAARERLALAARALGASPVYVARITEALKTLAPMGTPAGTPGETPLGSPVGIPPEAPGD
ncbi:MAG: tetratricopeptide repeat protein [Chloroflexia bacterium]|nr:tetratricopeptide repeat protein [Chloroflexia bacterium]